MNGNPFYKKPDNPWRRCADILFAAKGYDCGEEKSRFGADGQGPSVYLTDPEGNGVELKGPPAG